MIDRDELVGWLRDLTYGTLSIAVVRDGIAISRGTDLLQVISFGAATPTDAEELYAVLDALQDNMCEVTRLPWPGDHEDAVPVVRPLSPKSIELGYQAAGVWIERRVIS